jgi:hypothetical protein
VPSNADSGIAAKSASIAARILGATGIFAIVAVTAFLAALASLVVVRNPLPALRRLLVGLAAIVGLVVIVSVLSVFLTSRQSAAMCGSPATSVASSDGSRHPSAAVQPSLLTLDVTQPIQRLLTPLRRGAEQATPRTEAPTPNTGDRVASADMSGEIRALNGWTMKWQVSPDDGLVLRDVRLKGRCMAANISVPYLKLTTTAMKERRLELMPDSRNATPAPRDGRYLSKIAKGPIPVLPEHELDTLVIEAVYTISEFSVNKDSQLKVWVTYQFDASTNADCEPEKSFMCAKFYPKVSYEFTGDNDEELKSIAIAQRLHFEVDSQEQGTYAGLFQDIDPQVRDDPQTMISGKQRGDSIPELVAAACKVSEDTTTNNRCIAPGTRTDEPNAELSGKRNNGWRAKAHRLYRKIRKAVINWHPFSAETNPVPTERFGNALLQGKEETRPGYWDNVHIVSGTRAYPGHKVEAPGCPPCVHIHWRWTRLTFFLARDFYDDPLRGNKGKPIVPAESIQRVEIALTRAKNDKASYTRSGETWEENDPYDFRNLVREPEPLNGTVVLWYEGSSSQQKNTFFYHGGFFAPEPDASDVG